MIFEFEIVNMLWLVQEELKGSLLSFISCWSWLFTFSVTDNDVFIICFRYPQVPKNSVITGLKSKKCV